MSEKLRVIFFTHDSLFSARVLTELLQTPTVELVGIVQSSAIMRRNKSMLSDGLRLITVCGVHYTAYLIQTTLFYKKLANRFSLSPIKKLIKDHAIPILKSRDINRPEVAAFISSKSPDLCISAFFNQFIRADLLQIPPKGFINLHPSLLPKNRGVDPVFYAYLRKEQQGGITVHSIDQTLDTGNILIQEPILFDFEQPLLVSQWMHFDKGALLLRKVLMDIDTYLPGQAQIGVGNYDSWPKKKAVKQILKLM